jgi:hypothetical protein
MTERPERPLARGDFSCAEQWNRHCHEGGELPWCDQEETGWKYPSGTGYYSDLARAIYGPTERAYARTWEGYGVTDHLSFEHFERAYRALALANCRGRVLDMHISISWSTVGVESDISVFDLHQRFLELVRKWCVRVGVWPAWLWVLERGARIGLHTHMIIAIPPALRRDFVLYAKEAAATVSPVPLLDTPQSKTIFIVQRPTENVDRQWWHFRYLFKGLRPDLVKVSPSKALTPFAAIAAIRLRGQGEVSVKRFGVSRELDEATLKRWSAFHRLPEMNPVAANVPSDLYHRQFYAWYCDNWPLREPPGE